MRAWLERVQARDYFGADGRGEAEAAVERYAEALAGFELEALAAEQPEADGTGGREQTRRHVRAVDEG